MPIQKETRLQKEQFSKQQVKPEQDVYVSQIPKTITKKTTQEVDNMFQEFKTAGEELCKKCVSIIMTSNSTETQLEQLAKISYINTRIQSMQDMTASLAAMSLRGIQAEKDLKALTEIHEQDKQQLQLAQNNLRIAVLKNKANLPTTK